MTKIPARRLTFRFARVTIWLEEAQAFALEGQSRQRTRDELKIFAIALHQFARKISNEIEIILSDLAKPENP